MHTCDEQGEELWLPTWLKDKRLRVCVAAFTTRGQHRQLEGEWDIEGKGGGGAEGKARKKEQYNDEQPHRNALTAHNTRD